jgi:acetyl-CoA carboxylase carboxyl transferase subunit alpha
LKKESPSLETQIADLERRLHDLKRPHDHTQHSTQIAKLEKELTALRKKNYGKLSAWGRVQLARHPQRPLALDYIKRIFSDFTEIHGDRLFGDDQAAVTGFGFLRGGPVAIIAQQKGKDTQENIRRNFGMSHPEGYRKALRVMKLAEKFNRPIVTLIDTNGAYPGLGAEERGQAEAIARNLLEMGRLRVPVVACILGEGGSGGALGIGVANRVLMMENAWYSVISPEGCAAILWNNREMVKQASEVLKLTARDLLAFKVVDEVVPEPVGGAHLDHEEAARNLKRSLERNLLPLLRLSPAALEDQRYRRFRNLGQIQTQRVGKKKA